MATSWRPNKSDSDVSAVERRSGAAEDGGALDILWEDRHVLVVNKAPDLRMNGDFSDTLQKRVENYLGSGTAARHVHQLDFATSGVVVFGKCASAIAATSTLFQERLASKQYLAICLGHITSVPASLDATSLPVELAAGDISSLRFSAVEVSPDEAKASLAEWGEDDRVAEAPLLAFDVDLPIADLGSEDFRMCCGSTSNPGREAKTRVVVMKRGFIGTDPVTKVALFPVSGRRHQLRVHLAALGYPIYGDFTYRAARGATRMLLHAKGLYLPYHEGRKRRKTLRRVARKARGFATEAAVSPCAVRPSGEGTTARVKRPREEMLPETYWGGLDEANVPFPVTSLRVVSPEPFTSLTWTAEDSSVGPEGE